LAIARAFMAMLREPEPHEDTPFLSWLRAHGQTPRSIEAFWRPVVVGALNEEPERASTKYARMVFRDGFLGSRRGYEMGVPSVPLGDLWAAPCREYLERRGGRVECGSSVSEIVVRKGAVRGIRLADGA